MQIPTCPACGGNMRATPAHNATSRYARGVYICSPCGVREAFEGNFWCDHPNRVIVEQAKQQKWLELCN